MNELDKILNEILMPYSLDPLYKKLRNDLRKSIIAWHKAEIEKMIPDKLGDYEKMQEFIIKIWSNKQKHFAELEKESK